MNPIKSPQRTVLFYCILLVLMTAFVAADDAIRQDEFELCDTAESCQECLGTSVCDWYNPGTCSHSSMVIMDIARYSLQEQGGSVDELCQKAALDQADASLCSSQTDCSACTESLLSDGVSTCSWFAEFEVCGSEACTMMGCGDTSCEAPTAEIPTVANNKDESTSAANTTTASDCSSKTTCEECAATGDGSEGSPYCAWVPVFFYEHYPCTSMSCDTVADPNCYSREKDDRPASEICAAANDYYEQEETTDSEDAASTASASNIIQSTTSVGFAVLLLLFVSMV